MFFRAKGFTLIELIVVMGILAILVAIVLVAINPAHQFAMARNTRRYSDAQQIVNAVEYYRSESGGILPSDITLLPKIIGTNATSDPTNYVSLSSVVPTQIAELPVDPNKTDTSDTGYVIFKNQNDRIAVLAPLAELNKQIRYGFSNFILQFNGAGDHVEVPDSPTVWPTSALSISLWARKNGPGAAEPRGIMIEKDGSYIDICNSGQIELVLVLNGVPHSIAGGTCRPPGEWDNYAATYDGSTAHLYLNGLEIASSSVSGSVADTANPLEIGGDLSSSDDLNGSISDVRIYNAALSPATIQSINQGIPSNNNLVAYWNFDEGAKSTAQDATGNGNNGTLKNGGTVGDGSSVGPIWVSN